MPSCTISAIDLQIKRVLKRAIFYLGLFGLTSTLPIQNFLKGHTVSSLARP